MLNKNEIVPGTFVVIVNDKESEKFFSNKTPVVLTKEPGAGLDGFIKPKTGDILTILSKPKKYNSINCVKVVFNNEEYWTYYCSIKYMTKKIQKE